MALGDRLITTLGMGEQQLEGNMWKLLEGYECYAA